MDAKKELNEIRRLILEDNAKELEQFLNSCNRKSKYFEYNRYIYKPLLHVAIEENCQKVVNYLLSQDFADKRIRNERGENIYHVISKMRGAEKLFSIIEKKTPLSLLLKGSRTGNYAFYIACGSNNLFIVKRLHEILQSIKDVEFTSFIKHSMEYAIRNHDIEVIKYVSSIHGVHLDDKILFEVIRSSKIDIVIYLLNAYLCRSIPSHIHHQFHILQFSNLFNNDNNIGNRTLKTDCHNNVKNNDNNSTIIDCSLNNNNNKDNSNAEANEDFNFKITQKRDRDDRADAYVNHNKKIKLSHHHNDDNNNDNNNNDNNNKEDKKEDYLRLVENCFKRIMNMKLFRNRIWHDVCKNNNFDVVQLIFSLKEIQPEILNEDKLNPFLIACQYNSNIKVIKYLHQFFPSLINSQVILDDIIQNGAYLVVHNRKLNGSDKLKIMHYLYLNGIDIHILSKITFRDRTIYHHSLYSYFSDNNRVIETVQYLKVISQDFDYIHNEHDDKAFKKPSFWKEIDNNSADEQSKRINQWKNRFEEHVLRNLSKMIQQHMLEPNENYARW